MYLKIRTLQGEHIHLKDIIKDEHQQLLSEDGELHLTLIISLADVEGRFKDFRVKENQVLTDILDISMDDSVVVIPRASNRVWITNWSALHENHQS